MEQNNNSNQGEYVYGEALDTNVRPQIQETEKPFYKKGWFVILMLVVFWPAGLILMWMHKPFPKVANFIITILIVLATVFSIVFTVWMTKYMVDKTYDLIGSGINQQTIEDIIDTDSDAEAYQTENSETDEIADSVTPASGAIVLSEDDLTDRGNPCYIVGEDITSGKYKVSYISGQGVIGIYDGKDYEKKVDGTIGYGEDVDTFKSETVKLNNNDEIYVTGTAKFSLEEK